jgi:CheY-like chemotaxis protein
MLMVLRKLGYTDVLQSTNGQECVELYQRVCRDEPANPIHVILMDASMDVMDGLTASRKLRELDEKGGGAASVRPYIIAQTGEPSWTVRVAGAKGQGAHGAGKRGGTGTNEERPREAHVCVCVCVCCVPLVCVCVCVFGSPANVSAEFQKKCFDAGMDAFLAKPIKLELLSASIQQAWHVVEQQTATKTRQ